MNVVVARRSRQPKEKRLADILAAARIVFRERGYDEASITEIAARAGLVEGSIYRFFDTKRDLLVRVAELWYDEIMADYDRQLDGVRGTWNRLRFMIWHHLKSIHDHPELVNLIFRHIRVGAEYRKSSIYELNRRYTRRMFDILRDGMKSGELREGIPLRIARDMIYGCVEHHTWRFVAGFGGFDPDSAADEITDFLYRGIAGGGGETTAADRLQRTADRLELAADRLSFLARDAAK